MKTKILIFLTILSLVGCSKDDTTPPEPALLLPPETQTGANTFGCLINGKLLIHEMVQALLEVRIEE